MNFSFKAQRIATGEIFEGAAEATDKFALAHSMKLEGTLLLSAQALEGKKFSLHALVAGLFARVSLKERIFFANNLSEMISAGLSLTRALSVLERQSTNQTFKKIMMAIEADVNSGSSLSLALGRFPKVFSPIFIAMVQAGERSGRLPDSLKIVSDQMQKSYSLRKKVRGALIYPAIVVTAMGGIAVLMMIYVVPTLSKTFSDIGADLPFSTRLLIGTSDFLIQNGLILLIALIPFIALVLWVWRTPRCQRIWAWILLHLPLFKGIVQEMNSAITARTMSSLISSGVDIVEALRITEKVLQNSYYQEVLRVAGEDVPKGKNLSAIFGAYPKLYPVFVSEIIEVGEETGKMADMLLKLAVFYENEVDTVTKDMATVIEPLIMLVVGAGVAFFALSLIQPIYSIGDKL